MLTLTHDPLNAALEIREQLASDSRRLVFFFGAGTSMAVGLPGIDKLTTTIHAQLPEALKLRFKALLKEMPDGSNVEHVLDRIRTYRELIGEDPRKEYDGLDASSAKEMDLAICQAISESVRGSPPDGLKPHLVLAQWLRALHSQRRWPVEVFTTNYDTCIEQAMERCGVPFFDGFIGSVRPFFLPESVDAEDAKKDAAVYPPTAWTRLWKLHGSVNWRILAQEADGQRRITRTSGSDCKPGEELAIFPSREKYSQSRKLPFIAVQDRFRRSLSTGECLVVMSGYSFSDQHLNDIVLQSLRSNPHLAILCLLYDDLDAVSRLAPENRNLTVYGPSNASVGGVAATWGEPRKRKDAEEWPFWAEDRKRFTLGDFNAFGRFLEVFIGFGSSRGALSHGSAVESEVRSGA